MFLQVYYRTPNTPEPTRHSTIAQPPKHKRKSYTRHPGPDDWTTILQQPKTPEHRRAQPPRQHEHLLAYLSPLSTGT